ncbi:MAG: hypothetical protein JWQ51_2353, partial [Tardiphaga sp.]|nr:hypothetical protein [Tardiphaga sp.]
MTLSEWIGVPAGILILAFIFFAFRQGSKVRNMQDGDPPGSSGSG